jgi:tripartite-type tricarboxylate transporter receptor subunit TctC
MTNWNFGSYSRELFKMMAGVNLVHVPYRGAPAAEIDLISGQVQVMFNNVPNSIEHVRSGRLRALAVTTVDRLQALPGIPTIGEYVPGYEASSWWGLAAPINTPVEIVQRLNSEINAGLASPAMKARFSDLGATVFPSSVADFRKFVADETVKWAKVVKFAGVRLQ